MASLAGILWKPCAPMPHPRSGYAVGVLSSGIVFAGGSFWADATKTRTTRVDAYDTTADQWEELPPLPVAMSDAAFATVGDTMFTLGGTDGTHVLQDVYAFNRVSWRLRPDLKLPEPRVYASAVTDGKRLYLLGGIEKQDDYASAPRAIWTIDPAHAASGWTRLPDCPCNSRVTFGAVLVRNKIVLIGGLEAKAGAPSNLSDIWSLDLTTKHWKHEGDLPEGRRAMGVSTSGTGSVYGDDIYIFGGYTESFKADVLRLRHGVVSEAGTIPEAVAAAPFTRVGSRWYVTGGETGIRMRGKNMWSGAFAD